MVILILPGGLGLVLFLERVGEATVLVVAVGALPLGFFGSSWAWLGG